MKQSKKSKQNNRGITLIVLVITIIILLILAGITINLTIGQDGIINQAKEAEIKYAEAEARQKLELALLDLQADKVTNKAYNENEYIDNYLLNKQMLVMENIVLVDGWQFEIDRSVPKIAINLGQGEESKDIILTANVVNASDYTKASLNIQIIYEGEILSIQINGKDEVVPVKIDGKYVIEKEILQNGIYTIFVKDANSNYKIAKANVIDIAENLEIRTVEEMVAFRNKVNAGATYEGKIVKLMNDIDLQGSQTNQWIPIGNTQKSFKGEFDGQNNTINNVYIKTQTGYQALFGYNKGTLKNIIINGEITGNGYCIAGICSVNSGNIENCVNYAKVYNESTQYNQTAGIVARIIEKSTIKNCINYGEVYSNYSNIGGIVGLSVSKGFIIDSCNNYGKIIGTTGAGGIIGTANVSGTIRNCINYEEVNASSVAGGVLGSTNATEVILIQNSTNKGKIYAKVWAAGGIVGNVGTIANIEECINENEVSAGNGNCGGIVGSVGVDDEQVYTTNIKQCANKGYIHATGNSGNPSCGGIIGTVQRGESANISDCYNISQVVATEYTSGHIYHGVGGIVGTIYNNATKTTILSKATISNSYNRGDIKNGYSSSNAGQIIGRDANGNRSVTNCYYLSTATGENTYGGTSVVDTTLKTYASKLGTSVWKNDDGTKNLGYPIFIWE